MSVETGVELYLRRATDEEVEWAYRFMLAGPAEARAALAEHLAYCEREWVANRPALPFTAWYRASQHERESR